MDDRIDSQVLANRMSPQLEESELNLRFSQEPPANWTIGIDVSHWQGYIDWKKVASKGIRFSITKASDFYRDPAYPTGWVDIRAVENHKGAEDNNLFTGGYCWLQPRQDPKLQAQFYLDNFYTKYPTSFPPVLDFEDNNVISWSDMLWRAQVWLETVEKQTGRIPIVYTSPGYMSKFDKRKTGFLSRYHLWLAHYIQRPYPTVPFPWTDWRIWQYSDRGHYPYYIWNDQLPARGKEYGITSYLLDMNWYQGTEKELSEWLGEEYVEPAPVEPEPEPEPINYGKVLAWVLNVRSGVGASYPVVRTIKRDDLVSIFETKSGWHRIGDNEWVSGDWVRIVNDGGFPVNPPADDKKLFDAKCVAYFLYKRAAANNFSTIKGFLKRGDIVPVYEVKNGWYRIEPEEQIWVSESWMQKI